MFDLFKLVNEVPYIPNEQSDDTSDSSPRQESNISEVEKFKLLTATLCSCVVAYAQFNDQQNPSNPQDTLRKTMVFCDKLIKENLLSQDDGNNAIDQVKAMLPATKPSLCKRMLTGFCKIYKQYVPNLFNDDNTGTPVLKEEYDGKVDKFVNNAVNKALVLCGNNKGFCKFLGIDQPDQDSLYVDK
jgi:hypothetical protein